MKSENCTKLQKGRMCSLAKNHKLKKIEKLADAPQYICEKCARVANCDKNLCKPVEFK